MLIDGKQIKDASITDAKLVTPYTKADGTRPFTGDQSLGGNALTNVKDPVNPQDGSTKAYTDAVAAGARDPKDTVRAATTANITLSGLQTIDTVVLAAGDRVLVKNQSTASLNGIYIVASGAWTRSTDADNITITTEVTNGMLVPVSGGTNRGGFLLITADPITLGTTGLTFIQAFSSNIVVPVIADKNKTPVAVTTDNGTTGLTITNTPANSGYVRVTLNGAGQVLGDAVKTQDCYFSSDGGTTPKAISAIAAGDTFYWNAVITTISIAITDRFAFDYNV